MFKAGEMLVLHVHHGLLKKLYLRTSEELQSLITWHKAMRSNIKQTQTRSLGTGMFTDHLGWFLGSHGVWKTKEWLVS